MSEQETTHASEAEKYLKKVERPGPYRLSREEHLALAQAHATLAILDELRPKPGLRTEGDLSLAAKQGLVGATVHIGGKSVNHPTATHAFSNPNDGSLTLTHRVNPGDGQTVAIYSRGAWDSVKVHQASPNDADSTRLVGGAGIFAADVDARINRREREAGAFQ